MTDRQTASSISTQGIQLQLLTPSPGSPTIAAVEPKGVVYTKRWVVELILDLSGYSPERNLAAALAVEPAAGDGAFLGPMIERLLESCRRVGRSLSDCRGSLLAYELDELSAARARALAKNILVQHGVTGRLADELAEGWVVAKDYLFDAGNRPADFVIGNPPYVRLEDIPEETAIVYRNMYPTMRGRADLYVAFFEAALRQLKPGGVCAFICADRWMRNQYGAELRQLVTSAYSIDMLLSMHTVNAFDDEVDAYPAVTIIRHMKQESVVVASAGPEAERVQTNRLVAILKAEPKQMSSRPLPGIRVAQVRHWFKGADPWPCYSPDQLALLRRLEDQYPPLEASAKVGIGVATGNDSVYITQDPNLVEPSRLLKLALAKDLSSGTVQWSGHYLVNPWDSEGLVNLNAYPKLKAYVEYHASALRKRHTAEKNTAGWYKTIDRVNHGLLGKHKLYIPDIKNTLEPVLDRGETYPHHNLYFVQSDEWDLEVLGGLLMSAIGQFFVESYGVRMRGGYLRFQAQYLRRIRVPAPHTIAADHVQGLRNAFRERNRQLATQIALEVYGIDPNLMEAALEH
ncbi:Eco57I restriction-modification methylase domain-containing protein [Nitrospira moscoviensis]|uniref:site-specific DNA-methyltransferase (adenine-specific) n=1 Tax=Nitrospira moscoviensis TaxID=42253 RepID=A0A0K2GBQ7_NITMO|nr:Eco57I restriction-modification methylase domain-containing protein [Nitrospira moscoviensis]ALA58383.1 Modification methylase XhoI [Nitrospira moscoviensis]